MSAKSPKDAAHINRRMLVAAATAAGSTLVAAPISLREAKSAELGASGPAMQVWPVPQSIATPERFALLKGARIAYWDTGGSGPPIVLMHPATGSDKIWMYQQPAFTKAGFRVIAYSRRGYGSSDPLDKAHPGYGSDDLRDLVEFLELKTFSLVASAAGCAIAVDYALAHPDRLQGLVLSAAVFNALREPEHGAAIGRLAVDGFEAMPASFRELGPSYRAINPAGHKLWAELEHSAITGNAAGATNAGVPTPAKLAALPIPTLLIAGAADLYAPPSTVRLVASQIPGCELAIMSESGHSPHWEQPDAFNDTVIQFLNRRAR